MHSITRAGLVSDSKFSFLIVLIASALVSCFFYIFEILGNTLYISFVFFIYCSLYTMTQIQAAVILAQGSFFSGAFVSLVIPNLYFLFFILKSYVDISLTAHQVILVPSIFTFLSLIFGFIILLRGAEKKLQKVTHSIALAWKSFVNDYPSLIIIIIPFFSHLYYSAPAAFLNDTPEKEIAFLNTLRLSMFLAILNSFATMSYYKNVASASIETEHKQEFMRCKYWKIRVNVIFLNALLAFFLLTLVVTDVPGLIGLPIASLPIAASIILSIYFYNLYPLRDLLLQFLLERRGYVLFVAGLWSLVVVAGTMTERDNYFVVMAMVFISLGSLLYTRKLLNTNQYKG
ncbi:hypothetical protein N9141_01315 [bacterium]|nr:hypothetical protein [bacterium]